MINNYLKTQRKALISAHGKQAYSQVAVAKALGVSKSYVCRVENGTEKPSREFLVRISQAYGIDEQVTLAIGGHLAHEDSMLFETEPRCILFLKDLCQLDSNQLTTLAQAFEDDNKIELLSILGRNHLLAKIVANLLTFDTQELSDLKNALQDYTKQSLNFD